MQWCCQRLAIISTCGRLKLCGSANETEDIQNSNRTRRPRQALTKRINLVRQQETMMRRQEAPALLDLGLLLREQLLLFFGCPASGAGARRMALEFLVALVLRNECGQLHRHQRVRHRDHCEQMVRCDCCAQFPVQPSGEHSREVLLPNHCGRHLAFDLQVIGYFRCVNGQVVLPRRQQQRHVAALG